MTSGWRLLVVGLLVAAGATAGTEAARAGTADSTRVVRATDVARLFALDGTLLYMTVKSRESDPSGPLTVRWARVVDGERSAARGIPAKSQARAVGRDSAGHVVVTMQQPSVGPDGLQREGGPSWLYDVARDEARSLSVPATPGCTVADVAIWRERMAWVERCPATPEDPAPVAVGLRDGTQTSMWSLTERYVAETRLALGPGSLAVLVATDSGPVWVHRIVDRGRVCVIDGHSPPEAAQSIAWAGEGPGWYARGIWLGTAGLEWALANDEEYPFFTDLAVMASPLSGACQTLAEQRYLAAPAVRMRAVAIDGRSLYYATATAIYRHRLPARGTTKPPANDDFAQATFLGSRFPLHATGRIGHATRQRRDPRTAEGVRRFAWHRTVWYAFRPSRSGTVYRPRASASAITSGVFTRSRRGSLRRVREHTTDLNLRFAVEAGRKYWVMVGGGPELNYQPFTIDIRRRPSR